MSDFRCSSDRTALDDSRGADDVECFAVGDNLRYLTQNDHEHQPYFSCLCLLFYKFYQINILCPSPTKIMVPFVVVSQTSNALSAWFV